MDDLCVFPFMRSLSAERNAFFVRILITISPRMYREILALSIHRRRPDFEVLLAPPWTLDGETTRFGPHVLVQDNEEAGSSMIFPDGVVCRVRILTADRIDAAIELDGTSSEVHNVCLEDLFEVLEKAERLSQWDGG